MIDDQDRYELVNVFWYQFPRVVSDKIHSRKMAVCVCVCVLIVACALVAKFTIYDVSLGRQSV